MPYSDTYTWPDIAEYHIIDVAYDEMFRAGFPHNALTKTTIRVNLDYNTNNGGAVDYKIEIYDVPTSTLQQTITSNLINNLVYTPITELVTVLDDGSGSLPDGNYYIIFYAKVTSGTLNMQNITIYNL